jgi:hypothetical protein
MATAYRLHHQSVMADEWTKSAIGEEIARAAKVGSGLYAISGAGAGIVLVVLLMRSRPPSE